MVVGSLGGKLSFETKPKLFNLLTLNKEFGRNLSLIKRCMALFPSVVLTSA